MASDDRPTDDRDPAPGKGGGASRLPWLPQLRLVREDSKGNLGSDRSAPLRLPIPRGQVAGGAPANDTSPGQTISLARRAGGKPAFARQSLQIALAWLNSFDSISPAEIARAGKARRNHRRRLVTTGAIPVQGQPVLRQDRLPRDPRAQAVVAVALADDGGLQQRPPLLRQARPRRMIRPLAGARLWTSPWKVRAPRPERQS